ncbi:ribosomal-protein-L7/L12-serine acetyltransferase [Caudoviricetes sp.]|nr:ribosomal-protein-L7/L12-serine acetyltransferase [Caudoviricetes sp.]
MHGQFTHLKIWSPEWAPTVFNWYQSADYRSFFRSVVGFANEEAFKNYPQMIGNNVFGIFSESIPDKLFGLVTVYDIEPVSRCAKIGVMVDAQLHRGKIASDALITICRELFDRHNMRRIAIEYLATDTRITAFAHKFAGLLKKGYVAESIERNPIYEGRLKKAAYVDGKYHDVILLGFLKWDFDTVMEAYHGRQS